MMLRSLYKPLERCLGRKGDGLLWHIDLKPHATGDYSIAVVQANSYLEDQSQVYTSPSATYVGVYDGHGGAQASQFVNSYLFTFLHKYVSEHGGISPEVIKKAFSATEDEFLKLVRRTLQFHPQIASVGSCCLVGAIVKDELFVANLGDSRAVLGTKSSPKQKHIVAERLSTDHNVAEVEIRREVEALDPDDSNIVVYNRGVWRIKGIIQVSRSIGDVYLKKPDVNREVGNPIPLRRAVLSAEPSILRRKLQAQDMFIIFASDGLWEQLSDQAAVEIVSKNPRPGIAKTLVKAALQEAARKRELSYGDIKKIAKGIRRHFHDDISVVVVYLDHNARYNNNPSVVGYTTAPKDISSLNEAV